MRDVLDYFDHKLTTGLFRISKTAEFEMVGNSLPGLFGYTRKEIIKLKFDSLLADPFMYIHLKLKFRQRSELFNERVLMIRKDGSNFWTHLSAKMITERGEEGVVGCIEDISTVIALEHRVKDLENDYERTRYELDRFIYSASHDIRSPITSILGLINIMKMDYTDAKSKKFIELLEVSTQRLDRFVVDLSSFAENSRKDIKRKPIDFKEMLFELLDRLKDHPTFGSVKIKSQISSDAIFNSDFFRMRLVLAQVLKNSLDFCDLNKRSPRITIQISITQSKAIIEILDNGIGIAKAHLENVFDLFYRATSTSKGSGIGLYVTREAVIKLGGVITISSELGVGTSLKIELPNSLKGIVATNKMKLKRRPSVSSSASR